MGSYKISIEDICVHTRQFDKQPTEQADYKLIVIGPVCLPEAEAASAFCFFLPVCVKKQKHF